MKLLMAWLYCRQGVTAVEYGLIAAGISMAALGAIFAAGDSLDSMLGTMSTAMDNAAARIDS